MEVECEQRITRMEESTKSAHHRIDELTQVQQEIRNLAISVNTLASAVSAIKSGQDDIGARVREMELKPARRWDQLTIAIIISIATAIVGFIIGQLI